MPDITLQPLPPAEAIAFFEQKGYAISFDWRDVWQAEHQAAFTVAKVMQLDLLQDIRDHLDAALADGTTFEQFAKDMQPRLAKRGWWGRSLMTDPVTGEIKEVQLGSPRRLRTIYDTNLRKSYDEGQWSRIQGSMDTHPYLVYDANNSANPRESHSAWDGITLRADDPWIQNHYPRKKWGCKCRVYAITERQAQARGLSTPPGEQYYTYTNKRTGELQDIPVGVDPEFHYPPGGRQANLDELRGEREAAVREKVPGIGL